MRCGEFDLAELRALVGRAALYIGGDSGPLHVAATTRTPIVALFGPTLPERSMPWRDPRGALDRRRRGAAALPAVSPAHCVPGRLPLPDGITVQQVLDGVPAGRRRTLRAVRIRPGTLRSDCLGS